MNHARAVSRLERRRSSMYLHRRACLVGAALLCACARGDRSPVSPPERHPGTVASVGGAAAPAPPTSVSGEGEATADHAEVAADARYDLAADRERRARLAKEELGPKTAVAVVSDVFVVVGPPGGQGNRFRDGVALMRSAMAGYLNGRFAKKPPQAISVYLFPNAPAYESFCARKYATPCMAHFGFYQPNDRYMVMNIGLGLGTLTHEIVHPLVEADFPQAPTWINEGIASVFEQPVLPRPGEIHGGKNWRHPRLKRALTTAESAEARLDGLFGMADAVFRDEHEDLHYAVARYVCQWLDERGQLWSFYQRWRDGAVDDPTGEKAFRATVGVTPAEAHVLWAKWVLAL